MYLSMPPYTYPSNKVAQKKLQTVSLCSLPKIRMQRVEDIFMSISCICSQTAICMKINQSLTLTLVTYTYSYAPGKYILM